jgi:hypothetical protein
MSWMGEVGWYTDLTTEVRFGMWNVVQASWKSKCDYEDKSLEEKRLNQTGSVYTILRA